MKLCAGYCTAASFLCLLVVKMCVHIGEMEDTTAKSVCNDLIVPSLSMLQPRMGHNWTACQEAFVPPRGKLCAVSFYSFVHKPVYIMSYSCTSEISRRKSCEWQQISILLRWCISLLWDDGIMSTNSANEISMPAWYQTHFFNYYTYSTMQYHIIYFPLILPISQEGSKENA